MKKQFLATITLTGGDCLNARSYFGKSRYAASIEEAKNDIDAAIKSIESKQKYFQRAGSLGIEIDPADNPLNVVSWSIKEREVTPWEEVLMENRKDEE